MSNSGDAILPFCIFHTMDPINKNHKGIIVNPSATLHKDGKITYKCDEKRMSSEWTYIGTFYAVTPMFRPIPVGMRMFAVEISDISDIVSITDVKMVYGLYNFEPNFVYFITYNQPVIHTIPLYFHKRGNNVFPSFDSSPPEPGWSKVKLSPIFVMSPDFINTQNPDSTQFYCVNNRCLPWDEDQHLHYNRDKGKTPYNLNECVVLCNLAADSFGESKPTNILESVERLSRKKRVSNFFEELPPYISGVVIGIFVIILFVILYIAMKNKNEKDKHKYV